MPLRERDVFVQIFTDYNFKAKFPSLYMTMWAKIPEIPGEWEFAEYTHFLQSNGKECYSLRYYEMNDNITWFDLDWDNDTPFDTENIKIRKYDPNKNY